MKTSQWNTHWISLCILFFFLHSPSVNLYFYYLYIHSLSIYSLRIGHTVFCSYVNILCVQFGILFFSFWVLVKAVLSSGHFQPVTEYSGHIRALGLRNSQMENAKKILEFHLINLGTRSDRERFEVDLLPIFLYHSEAFLS